MTKTLVTMKEIDKSFPGVHALDHCQFDLKSGEVHALMGENGAGKSTLMKVLTGIYHPDSGEIHFDGKLEKIQNTKYAQNLGINIIHQELNLCPHLTVAQNIFIGREPLKKAGFIDESKMEKDSQTILDSMNLNIKPTDQVAKLTVAQQQMVEIAKALSFDARVLIMDEPTAALTEKEINELFTIIRTLKAKGVGIVYISHRMDEILQISDRISVMRDGAYIGTLDAEGATIDQIISMMVGRKIYETLEPQIGDQSAPIVLRVEKLSRGRAFQNVSFDLKKGEILGFAGLMGAGRTEVARAIFGADKYDSGKIWVNEQEVKINSPEDAVKIGIGYLSEDRKQYGLALKLNVEENIALASLDHFSKASFIDYHAVEKQSIKMVDAMHIKTPSLKQKISNLSGGNQQKVIIGKWLTRDCDILIFDEPTRGIDVGAKGEIYSLMNDLVKQGKSIIMISSEMAEILRMSHRVCVMCEGKLTGILDAKEASQEGIMRYATQRH